MLTDKQESPMDLLAADLKAKHSLGAGELAILESNGESVAVRKPTRGEWKRFKAMASDEKKRSGAGEALFRDCCIFPDDVEALLERLPAIGEMGAAQALKLAGADDEAEVKKY